MKKLLIISLGILAVLGVIGVMYAYNLLTEAMNDADRYHPPVVAPIVPKASADR